MNEDLDKLYKAVSSKFDVGSFDDFQSKMQTPEDRKKFYGAVTGKGFDLGDYASYEARLSSKKKDSSDSSLDQPSMESVSKVGNQESSLQEPEFEWYDYLNPFGEKHEQRLEINKKKISALTNYKESGEIPTDPLLKKYVEGFMEKAGEDDLEKKVYKKLENDQGSFKSVMLNIKESSDNMLSNLGASVGDWLNQLDQGVGSTLGGDTEALKNQQEKTQQSHDSTLKRLANRVDANNQDIQANNIIRHYDPNLSFEENNSVASQGIIETYQKDGIGAALAEAGIKAAESSPYLALSFLTGGAGVAATGGTFFATGYGGSLLDEYSKHEDPEDVRRTKAVLNGVVEGGASLLFGGVSKLGRDALKSISKEEAKKIVALNMKNQVKSIAGKAGVAGFGEGLEEAVQEVSSYGIDVLYGDEAWDRDRALMLAGDAFILGTVAGGPLGGIAGAHKFAKAKASLNETISEVNTELESQSTQDNPSKAEYLRKKKEEELAKIDPPNNLTREEGEEIDNLRNSITEDEKIVKTLNSAKLREEKVQEIEVKKEYLATLLSKYDEEEQQDNRSAEATESEAVGTDAESELRAPVSETGAGSDTSTDVGEAGATTTDPFVDYNQEEVVKFKEDIATVVEFIPKEKLGNSKIKVDSAEVLGEDVGPISAKRAHQELVKKHKKYEALIKCLG
jgi:hypothetical protein